MSSLISNTQAIFFTGALNDHFDTFARNITIHKSPIITPINSNEAILVGYEQTTQEVTYTPSAGTYPAIRMWKNEQPILNLSEVKAQLAGKGTVRIKVREDAMQFIENGPTERIEIDGLNFNIVSSKTTQNYLGLIFYIYYLESTT